MQETSEKCVSKSSNLPFNNTIIFDQHLGIPNVLLLYHTHHHVFFRYYTSGQYHSRPLSFSVIPEQKSISSHKNKTPISDVDDLGFLNIDEEDPIEMMTRKSKRDKRRKRPRKPTHMIMEACNENDTNKKRYHKGSQRKAIPPRWKYQNWRITIRFICPGSTRFGHKHRRKSHKRKSSPRIPLPVPVSDSDVKKDTLGRPSLTSMIPPHLRCCNWINSNSLILLIMLLCMSKFTNLRMHGGDRVCEDRADIMTSVESSKLDLSDLFSFPADWSLISSMNSCPGLRHLVPLLKMIMTGAKPMHMVDPSQTTRVREDNEIPDWMIEFRRKKAETKRKSRARANTSKNDPVPGRVRTKCCRERKKALMANQESTNPTNTDTRYASGSIFMHHFNHTYTHRFLFHPCVHQTKQMYKCGLFESCFEL